MSADPVAHWVAAPDRLAELRALPAGAQSTDVEAALRRLRGSLNGEDSLALALLRERVAAELRRIGLSSPAAAAAAALSRVETPQAAEPGRGRSLDLRDPEPWPEAVDGEALLRDVADLVERYIVLASGAAEVMALWSAHTYLLDVAEHTPYLALVSPTRRCGKTQALRIVAALARRALRADDVSPAALYRVIEATSPTLVIDELDRVHPDSDIWGIVNSGHTRGGAVLRCVDTGEDQEPRAYATWAPKVVAYIRGSRPTVPEATEDRCIRIVLQRRGRDDVRERLRSRELEAAAEPIRRRLMRWTTDIRDRLGDARPAIPDDLDDRAADGWEPLLAIADAAGGRWPARARELAVTYSADRAEDEQEAPGVLVVLDLAELLGRGDLRPDGLGLAAEQMVAALRSLPDRPWATWGKERSGLTPHALGRLLRPHGVRSGHSRTARRYDPADILAAAGRYAPTESDTSEQSVIASQAVPSAPQPTEPKGRDAVTLRKRHGGAGDTARTVTGCEFHRGAPSRHCLRCEALRPARLRHVP